MLCYVTLGVYKVRPGSEVCVALTEPAEHWRNQGVGRCDLAGLFAFYFGFLGV